MPTKAETLIKLEKYQKKINIIIPKIFYFKKKDYFQSKLKILKKIEKIFKGKKIILRSSSRQEDQQNISNAGKFKSYPNLKINLSLLNEKILSILEEFKSPLDQVIVQEFISKPDLSGVIFTRNINNNSPYYFINLDNSGRTDLITSGKANPSMKTLVFFRDFDKYKIDKKNLILLKTVKKIEKIFNNDRLDIEFCIKRKKIFIFQCRPLKKIKPVNDFAIRDALINITMKIEKLKRINPLIIGNKTYFSNMADWNPAEMIGNKPTTLSLSLYAELITDRVWATQRKDYGYQDLSSHPLMLNFGGSPYIDLRVDFNSFLPEKLDKNIKEKAINYYLNKINSHKELHDKVEFNIIETCFDLESEKNLLKFLNKKESLKYLNCLKDLTNDIFNQKKGNFKKELSKIDKLNQDIQLIKKSKLSEIHKIYFLINSCKNLGTLPFSGLARSAFIATKFLRSFVKKNIISEVELENFYSSINTITNKINTELSKIKNVSEKKKFIYNYGHLRPSTYSISSKNYKENFDNYFSKNEEKFKKNKKFKLNSNSKKLINHIFKKNKIKIDSKRFINFAAEAIRLREYSKFIFTKSVDEIFNNLIKLGKEIKILREDMEHLSIKNILKNYNNVEGGFKLKKQLSKEIFENKKNMSLLKLIEYPDFIQNKDDMYHHVVNKKKGNFITTKKINGPIIDFSKIKKYENIRGKIVLLENADPGYDFIFTKNIKGLITEYGGANSHMSIRCMELGIPAIIGIGSKEFNFLKEKKNIEINSFQKTYAILN